MPNFLIIFAIWVLSGILMTFNVSSACKEKGYYTLITGSKIICTVEKNNGEINADIDNTIKK